MKITLLIQKSIVAVALACLVTPSADAQIARNYVGSPVNKSQVSLKKAKSNSITTCFANTPSSEFGELELVMEEDFSKFASGSEAEPDMDAVTCYDPQSKECEYPWWNLKPEYTKLPHWGGSYLFPAGGMVLMQTSRLNQVPGHINTTLIDLSKYGGLCCIEFKAKTKNPDLVQNLVIECAETNNMSPDWGIPEQQITPQLTGEWQTFMAVFCNAGKTTLFNIHAQMEEWWYADDAEIIDSEILIDDIKAYVLKPYVNRPVNLSHKNYKGEEFDLTWDAVDGADSYVVNVWEIDEVSHEMYPLLEKEIVNTNMLHVADVYPECSYVFNVTAFSGSHYSVPSELGYMVDLLEPKFTTTPEIVKNETTGRYEFTSEWEEAPSAMVYNYVVMRNRVSWYDHPFTITDEDFTNMQDPQGNVVDFDEMNPCMDHYSLLPLKPLHQPGWIGKNYTPFTNFVCLDGWCKMQDGDDTYMASPELDLSKDNGKLHISMRLLGKVGPIHDPYTNTDSEDIQTKAAVSLYNYNETTGTFEQAEYHAFNDVNIEWNTFEVDLTKGSARSFIVIEPIEGPEHLYIDDLKIVQNYKKGETFLDPCIYEYWLPELSYTSVLPEDIAGEEIFEKVNAEKPNPVNGTSVFSNTISRKVGQAGEAPAGIRDAAISNKLISFANGQIVINNVNGEDVNVYTVDGKQVYSNNSGAANISVPVAQKGVYMVKVGNKSVKFSI